MDEPCRVCGDLTTAHSNAVCMGCAQPFHLALRQDIPAKDCGQVWIDDEMMALRFACDICLRVEMTRVELGPLPTTPAPAASSRRRYARRDQSATAVVRARRRR